ncbi:MAG: VacJ family lipoprotein, partial [Gammaproteobacteria bacterium]|nr:VacJ family lipoprotein [Gammaproteobacteria bacterium]
MNGRNYCLLVCLIFLTGGCATIDGPSDPNDPFERYNRSIYSFNTVVDENVLKPAAETYQKYVPGVISTGISNFFSNLGDVIVVANDLLQLKFIQAASDLTRIYFNTTIGLLGFIDVATHMDLRKHHEDFGQTLGYWGVPRGPYFMLPFFGPSTIRDTAGLVTDSAYIDPVYGQLDTRPATAVVVVDAIDTRASFLLASTFLEEAIDPYINIRDAYLQRRRNFVFDG